MKEKEFKQLLNDKIIFGDYVYDTDAVIISLKENRLKHYKLHRSAHVSRLQRAFDISNIIALKNATNLIVFYSSCDSIERIGIVPYVNQYIGDKGAVYTGDIIFGPSTINIDLKMSYNKGKTKYQYQINDSINCSKDITILIIKGMSYTPPIVKIFNNSESFNVEKEMFNVDNSKCKYNSRNSMITETKSEEMTFKQATVADKFNLMAKQLYHKNETVVSSATGNILEYYNDITGMSVQNMADYKSLTIYDVAKFVIDGEKFPEDMDHPEKSELHISYKEPFAKIDDKSDIEISEAIKDYMGYGIMVTYSDESGIEYVYTCEKLDQSTASFMYTSPDFEIKGIIIYKDGKTENSTVEANIAYAKSELYPLNKLYMRDNNGVPYLFVS